MTLLWLKHKLFYHNIFPKHCSLAHVKLCCPALNIAFYKSSRISIESAPKQCCFRFLSEGSWWWLASFNCPGNRGKQLSRKPDCPDSEKKCFSSKICRRLSKQFFEKKIHRQLFCRIISEAIVKVGIGQSLNSVFGWNIVQQTSELMPLFLQQRIWPVADAMKVLQTRTCIYKSANMLMLVILRYYCA